MKRLLILLCLFCLCFSAPVLAGQAMPGGKFTLGELGDDGVYRNAWAGLSFTPPDYYKDACYLTLNKSDVILNFVADDQKQTERLANMDFGRATAFYYSADGKGAVAMYVYNLDREVLGSSIVPDMGVIQGRDEFLSKFVEDCERRPSCTVQKAPYATVLGGRDFMACDVTQGGAIYRLYVQQVDNFLVVVYMNINKEIDRDWLFKEFEGGFNGGAQAAATVNAGDKAPDGKFDIGEYDRDTYTNSWLGMSFTAQKKFISASLGDDNLAFYKTDEASKQKLGARDFDKAWALNYMLEGMGGRLSLYVVNLDKEQENLGVVKDCDDYIDKFIAYTKEDTKILTPQFSEVYDAVLGGQNFKAFEASVLSGEMQTRYYVRQIDNFLVVVEMVAAKNASRNAAVFADFEASFTKYDADAALAQTAAKPAMDMGEYTADGYRNAWLGLAFTAPAGKKVSGDFSTVKESPGNYWFSDTGDSRRRIMAGTDIDEIYAFAYKFTTPLMGSVSVKVVNMEERIRNIEYVKSAAEYIAFEQRDELERLNVKIDYSPVTTAILGGREFLTYEYKTPFNICARIYVRQIDNWLLVVEMGALTKKEKAARDIYKIMEGCFSKYGDK